MDMRTVTWTKWKWTCNIETENWIHPQGRSKTSPEAKPGHGGPKWSFLWDRPCIHLTGGRERERETEGQLRLKEWMDQDLTLEVQWTSINMINVVL